MATLQKLKPSPSANHDQLSPLEQDVLWEYAKLGDKLKRVSVDWEKRILLVLTLVDIKPGPVNRRGPK